MKVMKAMKVNKQHGSTAIGLIFGVLIGLGVALGVAVYVMKVPAPFNNKSANRTPAQDAAESKKNKDWDPNAALFGKPVVKPDASAAEPAATPHVPLQTAPVNAAPAPAATRPATLAIPAPSVDGVEFYVQVGAFQSETDAQTLRAKLALSNFDGKVALREQAGQNVYRVRVGPLATQAAADKTKTSLELSGFDTLIVRAQR